MPTYSTSMVDFLEICQTKAARLQDMEAVLIVMGNESCDLDSAVCSLVYAFYQNCRIALSAIDTFQQDKYTAKDLQLMRNIVLVDTFHSNVADDEGSVNPNVTKNKICCAVHPHCLQDCLEVFTSAEKLEKSLGFKQEDMQKLKEHITRKTSTTAVFPMLNILKDELVLKTEVTFFLKEHNIPLDKLFFWDTLNLDELEKQNKLNVILVDHHVLAPKNTHLSNYVREITDHRPKDPNCKWPEGILHVVDAGSCATLIAEKISSVDPCMITGEIASLLYGPIVLDTACFSAEAKRATPLDHQMARMLECAGGENLQRNAVFEQLLAARTDISNLTSLQVLNKDYKVISGIPIASLPVLVQDFIKRPDWWDAVKQWIDVLHSQAAMLMGILIDNQNTSRDIALVDNGNTALVRHLVDALLNCNNPVLGLREMPMVESYIKLFQQQNIQASRKKVVPIITSAIESLTTCKCIQ